MRRWVGARIYHRGPGDEARGVSCWRPLLETACAPATTACPAQPAVLSHEPAGTLGIAAKLPIDPAHRDRRGSAAIGFGERAAVSDREIGHRNRHVRDSLEVIHAVRIRNVGRSALDVDHGRAQRLQHFLADIHARDRAGTVVQHAAVVDHQRLHAWVLRHLQRLQAAAAPIHARQFPAGGSGCWRHRPNTRRSPRPLRPVSVRRGRRDPWDGRRRTVSERSDYLTAPATIIRIPSDWQNRTLDVDVFLCLGAAIPLSQSRCRELVTSIGGSVMRMTPGPACLVLGLFLMAAPSVFAQASITGTVRDTSGAVLPGVTVEASSPALIEKVRTATTDGNGQYRIVDLRAGRVHRDVHAAGIHHGQARGRRPLKGPSRRRSTSTCASASSPRPSPSPASRPSSTCRACGARWCSTTTSSAPFRPRGRTTT